MMVGCPVLTPMANSFRRASTQLMKWGHMHILWRRIKQWAHFSVLATVVTWVLISAILLLGWVNPAGQPTAYQPTHKVLAPVTHTDPTSTAMLTSTLAAAAPGDWATYMADNGHSGFNAAENVITPATAPTLKLKWTHSAG